MDGAILFFLLCFIIGAVIATEPSIINFPCNKPVVGDFLVSLAGFEEACSYFVAHGSVEEVIVRFEMDYLDIDFDTQGRELLQLIVFAPGQSEGIRSGGVDVADGPYSLNTRFVPWFGEDEGEMNYRRVVLDDESIRGGGQFKMCLVNIKRDSPIRQIRGSLSVPLTINECESHQPVKPETAHVSVEREILETHHSVEYSVLHHSVEHSVLVMHSLLYSRDSKSSVLSHDLHLSMPPPPITSPTATPTNPSTACPSATATVSPTYQHTSQPTVAHTSQPTVAHTSQPTAAYTSQPTKVQTHPPTDFPTYYPTKLAQTESPTTVPTSPPTIVQTQSPTEIPTPYPTIVQTQPPSATPSHSPTPLVTQPTIFEFSFPCDEPVAGEFLVSIAGYEEECSYFVSHGSVNEIFMKFEISALNNSHFSTQDRELLQLIAFAPGQSEGIRFGDVDVADGPYSLNTRFVPWYGFQSEGNVNYRSVYLADNELKGDGYFKMCLVNVDRLSPIRQFQGSLHLPTTTRDCDFHQSVDHSMFSRDSMSSPYSMRSHYSMNSVFYSRDSMAFSHDIFLSENIVYSAPVAAPTKPPSHSMVYSSMSMVDSTNVEYDYPTFAPTPSAPTVHPSSAPTAQPSLAATEHPSSAPLSAPTNTPTKFGTTARPSATPTAVPTVSTAQLWNWKFDSVFDSVVDPNDVTVTYSEVRFADEILVGGCENFGVFLNTELPLQMNALLVQSINLFVVNDLEENATVATCEETSIAREIVSTVGDLESNSYTCSGNSWETAVCMNNVTTSGSMCANCTVADMCSRADAGECAEDFSFNPCSTSSSCTKGMIRILVVTFVPPEPAPIIASIIVSEGESNTKLNVAVTLEGNFISAKDLYCAAFLTRTDISSTSDVSFYNFHHGPFVNAANTSTIVISGLIPFTDYQVSCFTISIDGIKTSVSTIIAKTVLGKTACCKSLFVDLNVKSIFAGVSKQNGMVVSLESSHVSTIVVHLGVLGPNGSSVDSSPFFPASISFHSTSPTSSDVAFAGLPDAGDYSLNISFSGDDGGYELEYIRASSLTVLDGDTSLPAPTLSSVAFSSAGTSLTVTLDSASDSFGTVAGSLFDCNELFSFEGVGSSTCQFADPSIVVVYLTAGTVLVGDLFTILGNKLRAECAAPSTATQCLSWDLSNEAVVAIQAPLLPIQPVISISGPNVIGSCDSLSLDLSGSTGSGGRPWASIGAAITATSTIPSNDLNTSAIYNHLMNAFSTGGKSPIPREYLIGGNSYTFVIDLCNFMEDCSSNSYSVSVLSSAIPFIAILGPALRSITMYSSLKLTTSSFNALCDGGFTSEGLTYSWSVFENDVAVDTITSESTLDFSMFTLSPYMLLNGATYTFTVTVVNSGTQSSSTASASVMVQSSDLVAVIPGGLTQSIRQFSGDELLLTSEGTVDPDAIPGSASSLTFTWSCVTVSPTYSSVCGVPIVSTNFSESSFIVGPNNALTGTDQVSVITLTVNDVSTNRVASTTVSVLTVQADAPLVTLRLADLTCATCIAQSATAMNTNTRLILLGSVNLAANGLVEWSLDSPNVVLSDVALTPIVSNLTVSSGMTVPSNLALMAMTLPQRATLTFTLKCTLESGIYSDAQMVIVTNGPPLPGGLTVDPVNGTALTTSFYFSANRWTDNELPLTYAFSFVSPSSGDTMPLHSQSEGSSCDATLPAGDEARDNIILATVQVYDSLDAVETASFEVLVENINDATYLAVLVENLLIASRGSADLTKQAVASSSETLNSVNCTGAPNCGALLRDACQSTSQTCGPCWSNVSTIVGSDGDGNDACQDTSIIRSINLDSCASDLECPLWQTCDSTSTCVSLPMGCLLDCSGRGTCSYVNTQTLATYTEPCYLGSTICSGVCTCDAGYNGASCSFTDDDLQAKQNLRVSLLDSLVYLTGIENPSPDSVKGLLNSMTSLAQNFDELPSNVKSSLFSLSTVLLNNALVAKVSPDVIANILSIVNTASRLSVSSSERRLYSLGVSPDSVSQLSDSINTYVGMVQENMVLGQSDDTNIESMFRIRTSIFAADSNGETHAIAVPLSTSEKQASTQPLYFNVTSSVGDGVVSVVDISSSVFENSEYYSNIAEIIMTPYWGETASTVVSLELQNTVPLTPTTGTVTVYTTYCNLAATTTTYSCPDGADNLTVSCLATDEGEFTSTCSHRDTYPVCNSIDGLTTVTDNGCFTVSSTEMTTTCSCNVKSSTSKNVTSNYVSMVGVTEHASSSTYKAMVSPTASPTVLGETNSPTVAGAANGSTNDSGGLIGGVVGGFGILFIAFGVWYKFFNSGSMKVGIEEQQGDGLRGVIPGSDTGNFRVGEVPVGAIGSISAASVVPIITPTVVPHGSAAAPSITPTVSVPTDGNATSTGIVATLHNSCDIEAGAPSVEGAVACVGTV